MVPKSRAEPQTASVAPPATDGIRISQLWRYPVKSLRGEALEAGRLTDGGFVGDRVVHVSGSRGPLTGRTRHGLLTVAAGTDPLGVPTVGGHPWHSEAAAAVVRAHAGADARLVADESPARFDIGNLLVATDGAVERFGHDVRRLRPNIVLSGLAADVEPELPGRALVIGEVIIGLHSVRQRCIVTSIDPDTGEQDLDVFRRIRSVFGGRLALNSWVIRPGTVQVGDRVEIVSTTEQPPSLGGWIVGAPYPYA